MSRTRILGSSLAIFTVILVPAVTPRSVSAAAPQDTDMDNARVIQLTKTGLDDEIIIAKIKIAHCKFALGDNDLMDLKKAGVSAKVIAAMLSASVLKTAVVKVDGNPLELHTLGQAKAGGRLGHALTYGIKSVKQKAYLQGQHAAVVASRNANIEMELPPDDSADNYILLIMDPKGDRRELETGSVGGAVGAKSGVRAESIIKTSAEPLGDHRFKISPHEELKQGEYILYVVGSADYQKGIFGKGYDFTIE
jgi:hypothetical protein